MADTEQHFLTLDAWYGTELGQVVSDSINEHLQPIVSSIHGYHALQLGLQSQKKWLEGCPIKHKIFQSETIVDTSVIALDYALPFDAKTMDLIIAPNLMSISKDLNTALSEIDRVLVNHGHVIFLGFNKLSLWGLAKIISLKSNEAPWNHPFTGMHSILKFLNQYGYQIELVEDFFYRPPLYRSVWLERMRFLETVGQLVWPYPGGMMLVHARKQVLPITRIKPLWAYKNLVVGKRVVQPVSRIRADLLDRIDTFKN